MEEIKAEIRTNIGSSVFELYSYHKDTRLIIDEMNSENIDTFEFICNNVVNVLTKLSENKILNL